MALDTPPSPVLAGRTAANAKQFALGELDARHAAERAALEADLSARHAAERTALELRPASLFEGEIAAAKSGGAQ